MSGRRDLLLEIGTEELPARLMGDALAQLAARAAALLADLRLEHGPVDATGTPRRLVLRVEGVAERQAERRQRVRGPAAAAAFDAAGRPTPAALGFARSQGVAVEELSVEDTPAGRYVFATRAAPGRPALEVLAEALPGLITGLEFPRAMRWGAGELRFARPLRWLLALLGDEVIPFAVDGLASGRLTRGHRVLGPGPLEVRDARDYPGLLERAGVLVDHRRRREEIRRQVEEAAAAAGGRALVDEELLEEVTFLVEWPTAFVGRFPAEYLELPRPALETPMRHHQRYFPVEGPDGRLLNAFVGVRNGGRNHLEAVVAGNEKVLRARLADARYFFLEDTRRPLADYVERLRGIVFQARLGTVYEKAERVRSLAADLAALAGADDATRRALDRAAYLCKADLATSMVYEFPELQGVMGREYARRSGEPEAVAQAIYEHWLPRFAGDELPATPAGALLAVADKLDTLAGCFAAGLEPSGSQDPYGLRRQALGVIHVLRAAGTAAAPAGAVAALPGLARLSLADLVGRALGLYADRPELFADRGREAVAAALRDFFLGRLRVLLAEEGFRHEVVEAVLASGCDVPAEVWRRARALTDLSGSPELADAAWAFRRAANLAAKAETDTVRPELLAEEEERALHAALGATEPAVRARLAAGDPAGALAAYAGLRPAVDRFLDRVLVMAEDPAVRRNRLALLRRAADLGLAVADLGRLG